MKKFIFTVLFIFSVLFSWAQEVEKTDSLNQLKADSLKKVRVFVGLDMRYSFIDQSFKQRVFILGGRAGIKYNHLKYWAGFYSTFRRSRIRVTDPVVLPGRAPTEVDRDLSLYFGTLCAEYVFFTNKWFDISAPFEVGIGNSKITYVSLQGDKIRDVNALFMPVELGVFTMIKPTRWVGVNLKVGYRKTIRFSKFIGNYDGMYYGVALGVFLENIYADIKKQFYKKKK